MRENARVRRYSEKHEAPTPLVGRNVTFPGHEDPAAVARAIHAIVHEGISAEEAVDLTMTGRDEKMDFLKETIR